eukprot:TRINITY_DN4143_c0_g1_i2.p1 TRINITY_DN4143_c0_g1~~TRINITY_DN4143_c0_g1_i2.p1  ORF type:complete len:550 (+),score=135.47 TRINITY_DN4143_c0_g1_i2:116-1651(+)
MSTTVGGGVGGGLAKSIAGTTTDSKPLTSKYPEMRSRSITLGPRHKRTPSLTSTSPTASAPSSAPLKINPLHSLPSSVVAAHDTELSSSWDMSPPSSSPLLALDHMDPSKRPDSAKDGAHRMLMSELQGICEEEQDANGTVSPGNILRRTRSMPDISEDDIHECGEVLHEGWMYIKTMRMWQKRYFILQGQSLFYYKAKGYPCIGHVRLQGCQVRRKTTRSSKNKKPTSFHFEIYHPEKKYILNTQFQGLLPESVLKLGDHVQELPLSMRDLGQGTKDKIEHMKVLGTKIDKKMPAARNFIERQTNSTFVLFKLKDEADFEGWLKDIYSAISQNEVDVSGIEEVNSLAGEDADFEDELQAKPEIKSSSLGDEGELFREIEEIERQRALEERQREMDKFPILYSDPSISAAEREEELISDVYTKYSEFCHTEGLTEVINDAPAVRRFLRSCNYDLEKAYARMCEHVVWVHSYLPHEISLEAIAEEVQQHKVLFVITSLSIFCWYVSMYLSIP